MPPPRPELQFDRCEHRGKRARQQDASLAEWLTDPVSGSDRHALLAVVADGMGGHAAGEVASHIVTRTFHAVFNGASTFDSPPFERALDASSAQIRAHVESDPGTAGMGSTVVAALIDGQGVRWLSVGDSSLLLFRDGELSRLNANHSFGAHLDSLASAAQITQEQAAGDPRRHALMAAINGHPVELRDVRHTPLELRPGDWLMLATDGLDTLAPDEVRDIAAQHAQATPMELASALVDRVRARRMPEQDNVSVLAIHIGPTKALRAGVRQGQARVLEHADQVSAPSAWLGPLGDLLPRPLDGFAGLSLVVFAAGLLLLALTVIVSAFTGGGR